jgi:hypothetical protein
LFTLIAEAQINNENPFFNNYTLGENSEIIAINGGGDTTTVKIFDALGDILSSGITEVSSTTIRAPWGIVGDSANVDIDLVIGDFNGDGKDEFVGAWPGPDSTVTLYYSEVNPITFELENENPISIQSLGFTKLFQINQFERKPIIRLQKIQADNDPEPEFILAYWGDDGDETGGPIEIILFDNNGGPVPQMVSSISTERLSPLIHNAGGNLSRSTKFEMTAGDFDGDETEELVMVSFIPGETSQSSSSIGWKMIGTIYDIVDGELVKITSTEPLFEETGNRNEYAQRIALTAGDFNGDRIDELAFGFGEGLTNASNFRVDLYIYKVEQDLSDIIEVNSIFVNGTTGSDGWPMSLISKDINFDGNEDIIFAFRNTMRTYISDSEFNLTSVGGVSRDTKGQQRFHRTIALTDLDITDSDSLRMELVTLDDNGIRVWQNTPEDDFGDSGIQFSTPDNSYDGENEFLAVAIAVGDFDGDAVYLGAPTVQTVTNIVQPLIILNAPPIHFDVFDGVNYDINKCFNDNPDISCNHRAIYENATSQEFEVATEISADWGVSESIEIEAGVSAGPVQASVNGSLSRGYGENFGKVEGTSQKVTVKVTSDAVDDDRIYATISSYDIYEYPVFAGGEQTGNVIVVNPKFIGLEGLQNTWFGSKSGIAGDYINHHEVGNILSYPSSASLPFGATFFGNGGIEGGGGDTWELSNSSGQTWELRFSSESITQRTKGAYQTVGASVGASVGVEFGPVQASVTASTEANYSSNQISTHKTTVQQESALQVQFGQIDGSILGTKTYTVSPFVYWGSNGALILDYAVNPDQSAGVESWWAQQYGSKPDMTMILPWKYDEEKGLGSTNPELQSEQTRDIIFSSDNPLPGETISIKARIQNFSLTDNLNNTKIRFYLGDPREGGELIVNEQGLSVVEIAATNAREYKIATLENWLIPEDVGGNTFIYVSIDEDNEIDEVHEDNNIAWKLLNPTLPVVVSIEEETIGKLSFKLNQNYPNPFNPTTNITYELSTPQNVKLSVYDITGRKVSELVNERQASGSYTINFDAGNFASGVYIYTLQTRDHSISKRMVLIK